MTFLTCLDVFDSFGTTVDAHSRLLLSGVQVVCGNEGQGHVDHVLMHISQTGLKYCLCEPL